MAALAVSVGLMPAMVPSEVAAAKRVGQEVAALTHAARRFAWILTADCGAIPMPEGVVARARPVVGLARFGAVAKALATPIWARAVPELETWVASVAKLARA